MVAEQRTGLRLFGRRAHFYLICLASGIAGTIWSMQMQDVAVNAYLADPKACQLEPKGAVCTAARQKASVVLGFSNGAKAVVTLLLGPVCGSLSDVYGRLFYFTGSLALSAAGYVAAGLHVWGLCGLGWYLVLNALSGLSLPAFFAVVADEYDRAGRAAAFGLLLATYDIALCIVPFAGHWLTLERGAVLSNVAGFASILLAALFGETLPADRRVPVEEARANQSWRPDVALSILKSNRLFRRLSAIVIFSTLPMAGASQCFMMFMEDAYGYDRVQSSSYIIIIAVAGLVVQVFILPVLTPRFGTVACLIIGLAFQLIQNCLLTFVHSPTAVALACGAGGFGCMVFPCVAALKSAAASEQEQGRVQGAVSALQSSALGIGPVIYGAIFAFTLGPSMPGGKPLPSATFSLSILECVICIFCAMAVAKLVPQELSAQPAAPGTPRLSLPWSRKRRELTSSSLQEGLTPGCEDLEDRIRDNSPGAPDDFSPMRAG